MENCSLFLLNQALNSVQYPQFIEGMGELNLVGLEKKPNHIFYKHKTLYSIAHYLTLCSTNGYAEVAIIKFLEQSFSAFDIDIRTEEEADSCLGVGKNGFLGIDFSSTTISLIKQVKGLKSYYDWVQTTLSVMDKLNDCLGNPCYSHTFLSVFENLALDVQESILGNFERAKGRELITPFYPDTKIIKDVTPSNRNGKVMELRVYSPVALRVYFREVSEIVFVASIEQKSKPNQSEDILKAQSALNILQEQS